MATKKKKTKQPQQRGRKQVSKKRRSSPSVSPAMRSFSVGVLFVFLGLLLVGLGFGLYSLQKFLFQKNPAFEIQHLEISSDGRLSEDLIREYAKVSEGMNLFEVRFPKIEENLKNVSEVESVRLERQLPHTLIVEVKERVPVARLQGPNPQPFPLVIDRFGVVLPPRRNSTLPLICGLEENPRLGEHLEDPDVETALKILAISNSMELLRNYIRIEKVELGHADYIGLELEGGTTVRMSRHDLRTRLNRLASILRIQGGRVRAVDLTLDSNKAPVVIY